MDAPSKDRPDLLGYDNVTRKINEGPMLAADRSKKLSLHWQAYIKRQRPGDIWEVRKSGSPRGKLEPEAYAFVDVPEKTFKASRQYMAEHTDGAAILHLCKYWLDMTGLGKDETLTAAQFENRLKVKK